MSFPNPLSDPKPCRPVLTGAGGRLALLLALCLIPRMWMAQLIHAPCNDGRFHLGKAQETEARRDAPVDPYDFNVYPLILRAWHHAGVDWEMSAKVWGVIVGSLVVLPLFGLTRRMFDDRVALLAGLLYAAHPKLVEWSPEALRDPTYWFFFTLSLYASWRAVTEVRVRWFAIAGCATFLAANTRFEGWLLMVPMLAWCGRRWWAVCRAAGDSPRWRLVRGLCTFMLCYPAVLAVLVYSHGYQRWDWGSFHRLELVKKWVQGRGPAAAPTTIAAPVATEVSAAAASAPQERTDIATTPPGAIAATITPASAGEPAAAPVAAAPSSGAPSAAASAPTSPTRIVNTGAIVLDKFLRGYSASFGVLVLLGLCRWWRLLLRSDHQGLVWLLIGTLAAVWIHAVEAQGSSTRYLLPLVIISCSLAALGLLPICRSAARLAAWAMPRMPLAPHVAATLVLGTAIAAGCGDALTSRQQSRMSKVEIVQWIRRHVGEESVVVGTLNWRPSDLAAAQHFQALPYPEFRLSTGEFSRIVETGHPDVVLLCRRSIYGRAMQELVGAARANDLEVVPSRHLPASCRESVLVLVRGTVARSAFHAPAGQMR